MHHAQPVRGVQVSSLLEGRRLMDWIKLTIAGTAWCCGTRYSQTHFPLLTRYHFLSPFYARELSPCFSYI